jgi:hypothetical protein
MIPKKSTICVVLVFIALLRPGQLVAQGFIEQLTTEERAGLRISELSPSQIALLENAVLRYLATKGQELASVKKEREEPTAALHQRLAEREAQLRDVATELAAVQTALKTKDAELKRSIGELGKAMLGINAAHANMESRLAEPFSGWAKGTLFKLENGQVWRVLEGDYWSRVQPAGKPVKILAGVANSYFMQIDGVRPQPRVVLIGH